MVIGERLRPIASALWRSVTPRSWVTEKDADATPLPSEGQDMTACASTYAAVSRVDGELLHGGGGGSAGSIRRGFAETICPRPPRRPFPLSPPPFLPRELSVKQT